MLYKGQYFPDAINVRRIISGFPNQIDEEKVERYARIMEANDIDTGHCGFPPIVGFPYILTKEDIGTFFLNWDEDYPFDCQVTKHHLGQVAFIVTEGHHRSLAAYRAGVNFLEYEIDFNVKHA